MFYTIQLSRSLARHSNKVFLVLHVGPFDLRLCFHMVMLCFICLGSFVNLEPMHFAFYNITVIMFFLGKFTSPFHLKVQAERGSSDSHNDIFCGALSL